jgi:hypothetical protein
MKKLLMGSVVLLVFSLSLLTFQLSCTKVSLAKGQDGSDNNDGGKGKLVLYVDINTQAQSQARSFWLMNSNGTNRHRVNIVFPSQEYNLNNGRLVENASHIIFSATKINETEQIDIMYKCNIDGTGLTELFRGGSYVTQYDVSDSY